MSWLALECQLRVRHWTGVGFTSYSPSPGLTNSQRAERCAVLTQLRVEEKCDNKQTNIWLEVDSPLRQIKDIFGHKFHT
jgi:hypothetical protein